MNYPYNVFYSLIDRVFFARTFLNNLFINFADFDVTLEVNAPGFNSGAVRKSLPTCSCVCKGTLHGTI